MKRNKEPWYAGGLAFECSQCGRCCAGPEEGYVWLTLEEVKAIADHIGLPFEKVRDGYCRTVGGRLTLIEQANNDCIFLIDNPNPPGHRMCPVYQVRPLQCRTWPFWPGNLASPKAWNAAAKRCPGVNRGKLFPLEEIQQRMHAHEH